MAEMTRSILFVRRKGIRLAPMICSSCTFTPSALPIISPELDVEAGGLPSEPTIAERRIVHLRADADHAPIQDFL